MGNLEGTLSVGGGSKCGAGSSNCFAFQTPPSYAKWFKRAGFTTLNVANNHAFDFGVEGQRQTFAALTRVGVQWAGRPGAITTRTVRGVRVATVGFSSYPWTSDLTDIPAAKALVAHAQASADIVVVVFHGGAEGAAETRTPSGTQTFLGENRGDLRAFSRAVVDAGADLVWGSGPHVMRGMEFYEGRLIAYSLGNFAGYRAFGLGGTLSTGAVLRVRLGADGRFVSGRLVPTRIVGAGTPAPGGGAIPLVRSVSRADFGARAAHVSPGGVVTPPAA
ncbi:MAG: CapA family protein [Actinobacteria bacterium]|nr:CapA family protein [Actinomycetota bacterium]